jgi:hypothetical protein
MSEPVRLLEQGATPLERALLGAAAAERPGPNLRRRAVAALGLLYVAPTAAAAATPVARGIAAGASSKLIVAQVAKWCLVFGLGGGVVAGWHAFSESSDATIESPGRGDTEVLAAAPPHETSPVAAAQRERPAPDESDSKDEPSTSSKVASKPAPTRATAKSASPPAPRPHADSRSVRDQVALLDRARLSLSRGAPERALAALSTYRSRYPQGVLREEASVLHIETLRALGDREKEQAEVRRFNRRFPRSAHSELVQSGR